MLPARKKLSLSKETIRSLGASALNRAAGGTAYGGGGNASPSSIYAGCSTYQQTVACASVSPCPTPVPDPSPPGGNPSPGYPSPAPATATCGCPIDATGCCNVTASYPYNATCGYGIGCGGYATLTC